MQFCSLDYKIAFETRLSSEKHMLPFLFLPSAKKRKGNICFSLLKKYKRMFCAFSPLPPAAGRKRKTFFYTGKKRLSVLPDIVGEIKNRAHAGEPYVSGLSSRNQFANNILPGEFGARILPGHFALRQVLPLLFPAFTWKDREPKKIRDEACLNS